VRWVSAEPLRLWLELINVPGAVRGFNVDLASIYRDKWHSHAPGRKQGSGPTVLLFHGFPECCIACVTLEALAAAICPSAPDSAGYGQTDKPERIDPYTLVHLTETNFGFLERDRHGSAVVCRTMIGVAACRAAALCSTGIDVGPSLMSVPLQVQWSPPTSTVMPRTENSASINCIPTPWLPSENSKKVHTRNHTTLFAL